VNYASMTSEVKSRPRIVQCAIEALRSLALFGTLHTTTRAWTSIRDGVADWIALSIKRMFGWWEAKEVKMTCASARVSLGVGRPSKPRISLSRPVAQRNMISKGPGGESSERRVSRFAIDGKADGRRGATSQMRCRRAGPRRPGRRQARRGGSGSGCR
jgi:hypothetical protein